MVESVIDFDEEPEPLVAVAVPRYRDESVLHEPVLPSLFCRRSSSF